MFILKRTALLFQCLVTFLLITTFAHASDISCTYTVLSNWGTGSQVTFKITNNTTQDIVGWKMQVSYPQQFKLNNSWQVTSEGQNPIIFSSSNGGALKPGNSNSYHFGYQMNHNGATFALPTIDYCGEPEQPVGVVKQEIGTEGGLIELPSIGSVWFQDGALPATTEVSMSTSSEVATTELFSQMADLFRVKTRSAYEVRIGTGSVRPQSNAIMAELVVPEDIVESLLANEGIEIFAGIEQGGVGEVAFTDFSLLSSDYDATTNKLTFELPASAFANSELTNGEYQAILIIATTPGEKINTSVASAFASPLISSPMLLSTTSSTSSSSSCQAASISCPVAGGCVVNSPFVPVRVNPVTGQSRPHQGVDYQASATTSILAAANGVVERSQFHSGGHGEVITIRHTDGSATLYAHLNARDVTVGQTVTKGQQIGVAGKTGRASGVHLHFEYVPNGEIFGSKDRIDPDACIDALSTGSITIYDSGNLADDAFMVMLGGYVLGQTSIGGSNTLAVSNLRPGLKPLRLTVIVAPDNVGTYSIQLNDGLTFLNGSTFASGNLPQGVSTYYDVIIP